VDSSAAAALANRGSAGLSIAVARGGHPNLVHQGGIPGFNSILVYFPKEKLTIAVISNSPVVSAGELAARIARDAFALAPASATQR
jgi:hypothetical protein